MVRKYIAILWLPFILLVACIQQAAPPSATAPVVSPAATVTAPATATALPASATILPATPTLSATEPATALEGAPAATPAGTPTWAPPVTLPGRFSAEPLSPAEERTAAELAAASPPERDDVALARAYKGVTALPAPVTEPTTLAVGTSSPFTVLNLDNNTVVPIEATLLAVSEHAYFWFDNSSAQPNQSELAPIASAFDEIYEIDVAAFGEESNPGIDGDPRVHIVHASPSALCVDPAQCGLAGYFSAMDALPSAVSGHSNEREMFVMNVDQFGTDFYLNVLAHEFRHMIEDNYDQADIDWEIEGSASLAEELAGFSRSPIARGNGFLAAPDQQLNSWTDGDTYTYYGMGYVLNRYIYDRLGPELYKAFATSPADGLQAVTAVAEENGLDLSGEQLWLDWLVALAVHSRPAAAEEYRFAEGGLDTVAMTDVDAPASYDTTVNQYAADYYRLRGDGSRTIEFSGSQRVPLLAEGGSLPSGSHYWYANRANYSEMTLTRPVDLRNVQEASLNYSVYHDIEYGYDFAYVTVSSDGGETWQGLVAEHMQGLVEADNPSGKALADRFYTGQSDGWLAERIDLTPYAGQEIMLRFSYITDPILTFGGLALDNIAIPEIGFYDDAEAADGGWVAAGFTRATAMLPQEWPLQLITFPGGVPTVTALSPDASGMLTYEVELGQSGGEAILIVAARAPLTLEKAAYELTISN